MSFAARSRRPLLLVLLALAVLLAVVLSLTIGARTLSSQVVWHALLHPGQGADNGVIWDGRLPRTVVGLLAGVALGVAGALMQALTRNPLADPGILGVNAGAAFFVVIAVGFVGIDSIAGYIWFAFAGALLAAIGVHLVGGGGRGSVDPVRLALAGVALSAVLTGISEGLAQLRPQAFDQLRSWSIGSLDVRSFAPSAVIVWFVLAGLLVAALAVRGLNALGMGEDVASSLGVNVTRTRVLTMVAITLLAGSATAAVGALSFIGLMVPHFARRLVGPDQRWVVLTSALIGPVLLLVSDVIGRLVHRGELPAGVVIAFVGAPFLIALARRRRVLAL